MSYAPINNILVVKGKNYEQATKDIVGKINEYLGDGDIQIVNNKDNDEKWFYFTTNNRPFEKEIAEYTKDKHNNLRVFYSSTDFDGFAWNYYKEIGVDGEYPYHTGNVTEMTKKFADFIRK